MISGEVETVVGIVVVTIVVVGGLVRNTFFSTVQKHGEE
jgi:hypothetical protein